MPEERKYRSLQAARRPTAIVALLVTAGLVCADAWDGRTVQAATPEAAATPRPAVQGMDPDVLREVVRNGEAGFIVTEIAYVMGPDAKHSGACPAGMTGGLRAKMAAFKVTPAGAQREGEAPAAYEKRLENTLSMARDGRNLCMHPELGSPDPGWRMVSGPDLRIDGVDLDGRDSRLRARPAPGTCGHRDFRGTSGEAGIDNQFYRVVGCTTGFQSTGQANSWQIEMKTGSWGILMSVKGIEDIRNDPEVQVGIYASADPIQLSPARSPLAFATYAMDRDPRYRATTRGRIVDGVLTIDPVDVRVHNVVASYFSDRILRDARLRLTFTPDGGMEGFLAGYTPVDNMFDLQFGARSAKTATGQLAPEARRISTSVGRAGALGHTCDGAYFALKQAADGHPDASGSCTSISTQYRIKVAPAFVVDAKTQSVNAPLAVK
jgi:hypothetical protein